MWLTQLIWLEECGYIWQIAREWEVASTSNLGKKNISNKVQLFCSMEFYTICKKKSQLVCIWGGGIDQIVATEAFVFITPQIK